MKAVATAVIMVLAVLALLTALEPASAELRSEPWACYARGYVMDLNASRVNASGAVRSISIRDRLRPQPMAAEVSYSFNLYGLEENEWGVYLTYLVHMTDVDEGFAAMLAKVANGESGPVELVAYGGGCPKDGRSLRGADSIRLLDYDLEPVHTTPTTPTKGSGEKD